MKTKCSSQEFCLFQDKVSAVFCGAGKRECEYKEEANPEKCVWKLDDDKRSVYMSCPNADCWEDFSTTWGYKYCPYCGREIEVKE